MLHFKERGRSLHHSYESWGWGPFTRYVEVADDRLAARQVEVFDDGRILRYDRAHPRDAFGQLVMNLFSRKPKWAAGRAGVETIDAAAFDRAWRASLRSPLWAEQVRRQLPAG